MSLPTAPEIRGYTAVSHIGSGGYADVFLYEQQMPFRRVAVKVLKPSALVGDVQRRQFTAEANSMAKVSTHPFIVSIFHADIASDGRPYLVMEYFPGDNYLKRARQEQFGVPEALRAGIQIGSAVETAHRAGILHRDIKPANVLTSEFRRPGLTDFGIAAAAGSDAEEVAGISIPWSPPEAFGAADLGVAADVYSLAATVYHLLAGRSPYEVPGGDNSTLALIARIERGNLPSLGRPDVPAALERVLAQAMSARLEQRPARVVDFLRQLQSIESAQHLAVTPLELADDTAPVRQRVVSDDDDATRIKGVTQIQAQDPVAIASVPASPTGLAPQAPRTRERMLAEPEAFNTVHRPAPAAASPVPSPPPSRRRPAVWVGSGLAVLAVVALAVAFAGGSDEPSADVGASQEANDNLSDTVVLAARPVPVASVAGSANGDGSFTFTWTAPDGGPWSYVVTEVDAGESPQVIIGLQFTATTTCIDVETMSEAGVLSAATRGCAL